MVDVVRSLHLLHLRDQPCGLPPALALRVAAFVDSAIPSSAIPIAPREPLFAGGTVPDLFQRQVASTPDAVALWHPTDGETSYHTLSCWVAQAVEWLVEMGLHKGDAFLLAADERGVTPQHIVVQLASMTLGTWYAPVDLVGAPKGRVDHLVEATKAKLVIYPRDLQHLPPAPSSGGPTSCAAKTRERPSGHDMVYTVFTSGSTGKPKGVLCRQETLCAYAQSKARDEGVAQGSRLLLASPLTFDPCQGDMATALLHGATLCLVPDLFAHFARGAETASPTHICTTPALLELPLPRTVGVVSLGGEATPHTLSVPPGVTLKNVYGVTEGCVYQTVSNTRNSIGHPYPHVRCEVVDSGERVGRGAVGELWLGGVFAGYLNGRRPGYWYATGDYVRETDHGLVLLGRRDDQIKIRGRRVELGEIASAMAPYPARAFVLRGRVALVVATTLPTDVVRAVCEARLPAYLIPTYIFPVAELPLLPSGKIDRTRFEPLDEPCATPQHDSLVARVWAEELGRPVGPATHWMEAGGDSLGALRVVRRLRIELKQDTYNNDDEARYGVIEGPFSPAHLLRHPVLSSYVCFLEQQTGLVLSVSGSGDHPTTPDPLVDAAERGDLSSVRALIEMAGRSAGPSRGDKGMSPLHTASSNGHIEVVEYLLSRGAGLYPVTGQGAVPLHLAAYNGHVAVLRVFAAHGASVNVKDNNGQTVLHYAARGNHPKCIEEAVQHGVNLKHCFDRWGRSPVHWAALGGHVDAVETLIRVGMSTCETRTLARRTRLASETPLELAQRAHGDDHPVVVLLRRYQ